MKRVFCICGVVLFALISGRSRAVGVQRPASVAAPATTQQALVQQYCITCHSDRAKQGGLSLENQSVAAAGDNPELWEKVVRKLRAGVMPPPGVRRPPLAEYEGLRDWLEADIDRKAPRNPGAIVLHRLNRTEYANAVRDLLDLEIDVSALLPPDDSARGFDNIAGSLTISPTLLEAYVSAAARVSRMAVGYWKTPTEAKYIAPGDNSQNQRLDGLPMGTRGGMAVRHHFPADGEYTFEIQNYGIGAYIPGERLELSVDGERVKLFDYVGVGLSQGMSGEGDGSIEITVPVKAGSRMVGATFLAPASLRPSLDSVKHFERTSLENNSIAQLQYPPVIGFLRILGPFHAARPTDSRSMRKILTCKPKEPMEEEGCAKQILSTLARRAYRRPVAASDIDPLMDFYKEGRRAGAFEDGIELGLRRILASPQFLVRAEKAPANIAAGQSYRITDLELASRLSFFLWSSIPDDELINVAGQNRLRNATVLEQQVRRMLADPKAAALVETFAAQYLYLRNLPATSPSSVFYPEWDHELRMGFQRKTELLFDKIIRENRTVLDLLNADYTLRERTFGKALSYPQHLWSLHPADRPWARDGLPPRDYGKGASFRSVGSEFQNVAVKARCLGPRKPSGHTTFGTAAECTAARRTKGSPGKTPTLRERSRGTRQRAVRGSHTPSWTTLASLFRTLMQRKMADTGKVA